MYCKYIHSHVHVNKIYQHATNIKIEKKIMISCPEDIKIINR